MGKDKNSQKDMLRRYAHLIEIQTGHAVRPYRADGYVNLMNKYGTQKDVSEGYRFQQEPIIPDDMLTQYYEGNGLFAKIIDTPAEEAIKHGFHLDGLKDAEIENFYVEALDELDWEETAMTCIKWARLFGGSIAVLLVNDGRGLEEPLDWKNIRSIDDIRVYDRSLIQPDYSSMFNYQADDPFRTRGSRLGMPEHYDVFSKHGNFRVHDSRCLVFPNGTLPENTTNSIYQIWGIPEYVRINKAIRDAEVAHGSAVKLLDRSIQAVYKMKDLSAELATEEGEDRVLRRLQTIDMARGMLNSITIDSEGEDYDFRTFQFGGVPDVIDTTCNYLSALTSIPQTILFGRSPAGMNATGTSDLENWYNYLERIQKRMVRKNLRYLLSIIFQAGVYTGEIDEVPNINIKFNPLWSLSDAEQTELEQKRAMIQQTKAQTAQIYVDMEAIDPSEVRKKLADSEEFDVENMLDEVEAEDLFADLLADNPMDNPSDIPQTLGQEVSTEEHETENSGNAPTAAPTATKLPQDMSEEELQQAENTDEIDYSTQYGVGVLVVKDGKILVGTRHNDFGYGLICGPGGHIEKGETPEVAAYRETEEEFGISPKELIQIGMCPKEPDTKLQSIVFLCTDYDGVPKSVDLEMVRPEFKTLDEIMQMESSLFQPFRDSLDVLLDVFEVPQEDGGPGSGNHGHEGVEGQLGGSAPSGSNVGGEKHKPISERTKPAVKSPKNFEEYVKKNGLTPIYRGYSAENDEQLAEYQESYKNGTVPESGDKSSALGKGVYFATSQTEAEGYRSRRQEEKGQSKGRITTAALDVDAKVADYNEMKSKKLADESDYISRAFEAKEKGDKEEYNKLKDAYYKTAEMSFEEYVKSQGVDAIIEPALGYVVVINQKALVIRDDAMEVTLGINENGYSKEKTLDISTETDIVKSQTSTDEGNSNSGNHGHKGVPGQRGGSAPSGKGITRFQRKNENYI